MTVHRHAAHPFEDIVGLGCRPYRRRIHVDERKTSLDASCPVNDELDVRERDADFGKGRAELWLRGLAAHAPDEEPKLGWTLARHRQYVATMTAGRFAFLTKDVSVESGRINGDGADV